MDTCSVNPYNVLSWTTKMLQEYAEKYKTAYENNVAYQGDIQWIFSKIRDAVIFMVSDLRSTTNFGADFKDIATNDALEAWIIEHVFPKLESSDWPSPGTAEFVACINELKVEITNVDPAVIELRDQLSSCGVTI